MKDREWGWVGACSVGTRHLRSGSGCEDAAACIQMGEPGASVLMAVAADGAGSARMAGAGARIVVRVFAQAAKAFVAAGGAPGEIDLERACDWIDAIRDRIAFAAGDNGTRRDYAATLVGCLVAEHSACVIQVGDGACALRQHGYSYWHVPIWPAQGEYASTTHFVTDDPAPLVSVTRLEGTMAEIAVFTDGLERLALDFSSQTAFAPFFESMFCALRKQGPGRQRALSRGLRAFLDSPTVTRRTDDDKTLILARRVRACSYGSVADLAD